MNIERDSYLAHYGILRKSGRYPWGSGGTQSARNRSFLDTVAELRKSGMSEAQIAASFSTPEQPFSVATLRALKSIALNAKKQEDISTAQKLADKGLSNVAIGKQMGINESSVRNLLAPGASEKAAIMKATSEMLRQQVEEKQFVDVGAHVNTQLNISPEKLRVAVAMLKEEGYRIHYIKMPQVGTGHETTMQVLAKPDITPKEVWANRFNIRQIQEYSDNGGRGWLGLGNQPPIQVDLKRVGINYKEDGGDKADGVIYVRPNVHDVSLGQKQYAQVRVAVNGTHFIKGMAVYKDDLPDGVDLVFNTNKSNTGNKLDALKPLKRTDDGKIDTDNPFGAVYRQLKKLDEHGNPIDGTVRSAMNIVNDEGEWDKWSRTLSTQFLSKQSPTLARQQLAMTHERKSRELDEILALTNPVVRKKMLESFADDADSSAVHMKAMQIPRQRTQVIMPVGSLKDNEVYAPNFKPGETVVLVRHPHGGKFEIPELVVNNQNREARRLLGPQAKDAIGINAKVAARLSGADFDGDTVLVIPNGSGRIKTERALEGLKNFDPQSRYAPYDGMRTIDGGTWRAATKEVDYEGRSPVAQTKQHQMGLVSNLITDMTIKGASNNELAAAVRHSMVVIDAEKHHLDYKRSARENGISALQKKYQGRAGGTAATLISRAKSPVYINERKARPAAQGGGIDRTTGKRVFVETGRMRPDKKTGEPVPVQQRVKKLELASDAHSLTSGTRIEEIYANHSNNLKALADRARKEMVATQATRPISESAKRAFAPQVVSLNAKLKIAEENAPRERQAQVLANSLVAIKKQQYPDMEKADIKKISGQALAVARKRTGAHKERVVITDDEWAAIQAGAISSSRLERILRHADVDEVKRLATPRKETVMTSAMQTRARSMLADGYSQSQVADQLGVALSTLKSSVLKDTNA